MSKLRWFPANLLNKFKDTCWAELVMWAIDPCIHPLDEIFEMRGTAGRCARYGDSPYCGKCSDTPGRNDICTTMITTGDI